MHYGKRIKQIQINEGQAEKVLRLVSDFEVQKYTN